VARRPTILFVHDSFPAQFGALGAWLARSGWEVAFATAARSARAEAIRIIRYAAHREPAPQTHPYALPMERAALKGQAFARAALAARRGGFRPDVVVAHSGWGSGLYARDVFPEAAFVAYCEWWYNHPGPDVAFLTGLGGPEVGGVEAGMIERGRNAPIALDIAGAAAALCPTRFQAGQFPHPFRRALTVLHDGIDTEVFSPEARAQRDTLGGLVPETARVVTYATRGMEPHRGFPQFVASLREVFAAVPDAVAVVAGRNEVAYGGDRLRGVDWKARALAEHDVDPHRVHFVGHLAHRDYLRLLGRSDAHVYLTVPFVLSWSMLEAMSVGCALVASSTEPVTEFANNENARLVDLHSPSAIAAGITELLLDPAPAVRLRTAARRCVEEKLSTRRIFRAKRALLESLI
jgi:glycosyltransferase involved in cell wall biosynthesis